MAKLRANERKWGLPLVKAGWTMVPSTILERQAALGLDPVDMNIILQLASYWWVAENPPFPAISTIAKRIGKSVSTVQRRISLLKEAGLIEIEHRFVDDHGGQTTSFYRFAGLINASTEFAKEALDEREMQKRQKSQRLQRKNVKTGATLKVADGTAPAKETRKIVRRPS